jgi:hypothetical protein
VALPKLLKGAGGGVARMRKSGGTGRLKKNADRLGKLPVNMLMS